jgi:hypothetical protein
LWSQKGRLISIYRDSLSWFFAKFLPKKNRTSSPANSNSLDTLASDLTCRPLAVTVTKSRLHSLTGSHSFSGRRLMEGPLSSCDFANRTLKKLPERIGEAEAALVIRARELLYSSDDDGEEQKSVNDAMYILHALSRSLGRSSTATPSIAA